MYLPVTLHTFENETQVERSTFGHAEGDPAPTTDFWFVSHFFNCHFCSANNWQVFADKSSSSMQAMGTLLWQSVSNRRELVHHLLFNQFHIVTAFGHQQVRE